MRYPTGLVLAGLLLSALPLGTAQAEAQCTDPTPSTRPLPADLKVGSTPLHGLISLPKKAPRKLAVFAHGYQNASPSWAAHLRDAATRGAVAVAVDYRGIGPSPTYS